jgi:hypothetical protein
MPNFLHHFEYRFRFVDLDCWRAWSCRSSTLSTSHSIIGLIWMTDDVEDKAVVVNFRLFIIIPLLIPPSLVLIIKFVAGNYLSPVGPAYHER